jgi:hypothetical protein
MEDIEDIYENENLKWIRDARNRTYEETKNMTLEEKKEYFRKKHENIYDVLNNVNPDDFSFLNKSKKQKIKKELV